MLPLLEAHEFRFEQEKKIWQIILEYYYYYYSYYRIFGTLKSPSPPGLVHFCLLLTTQNVVPL